MKDTVVWWCLWYSTIAGVAFAVISWWQSGKATEAKQLVAEAKDKNLVDSFDAGKVLESGAKLVDAFTKAGPAMASLGASIVALGFAAYIVAQPPKDEEKAKGDKTGQTTQPATLPPAPLPVVPDANKKGT